MRQHPFLKPPMGYLRTSNINRIITSSFSDILKFTPYHLLSEAVLPILSLCCSDMK